MTRLQDCMKEILAVEAFGMKSRLEAERYQRCYWAWRTWIRNNAWFFLYSMVSSSGRGISAAGSAPHWQCGGHGFESRMLHYFLFTNQCDDMAIWYDYPVCHDDMWWFNVVAVEESMDKIMNMQFGFGTLHVGIQRYFLACSDAAGCLTVSGDSGTGRMPPKGSDHCWRGYSL